MILDCWFCSHYPAHALLYASSARPDSRSKHTTRVCTSRRSARSAARSACECDRVRKRFPCHAYQLSGSINLHAHRDTIQLKPASQPATYNQTPQQRSADDCQRHVWHVPCAQSMRLPCSIYNIRTNHPTKSRATTNPFTMHPC